MAVDLTNDVLWEATGHATATASVVVTHPDAGGTTAGSTVIVATRSAGAVNFTPPTGWRIDNTPGLPQLRAYRYDNIGAGETSWTWTRNASGNTAWYMLEIKNLSAESFEVATAGTQGTLASGGTRSTGTSVLNAGSNALVLAVFASSKAGSGDTHSWASYTNSFTERVDFNPAGVAGECIAIAAKVVEGQSTFETTGTFTTSTGSPSTAAMLMVYRGGDAAINAPLAFHTGFEFGTYGGMNNGTSGPLGATAPSGTGTTGTNCRVISGAARYGSYGLEVDNSATTMSVPLPAMSASTIAISGNVQAVSGTGTPVAAYINFSGQTLFLDYDVTNTRFGLRWSGGGTTVWQNGTTPLGTWAMVEIRAKFNGSPWHAEWWIETGTGDGYQTSPTDLSTSAATTATPILGSAASQTAKFYYDDWVYTRHYAAYPMGVHQITLLVPETTGATISGTSTNFQRFTANGTLAAVNGTEGALLDDVPPTVSAASDGVVQVNIAASDYIELPMTTYTCDSNEIIAGVRFVASEWGGTGTGTGTLGWYGWDGLTETTFQAPSASYDADSLTAISATYPRWVSAMWSGATNGAWNQTRLNAAAIRMGRSTDATPDMGASAVYLEVATRTLVNSVTVHRLTDDEDPEVNAAVVTETLHPYNSGVRVFSVSNDNPTRTAVFNYSIGGTPQTPVVVAPSDPPVDVTVGAEAFGEVDSTSFSWQ